MGDDSRTGVTWGEGDATGLTGSSFAGTPAIVFGTTNSSGVASTLLRTDDQIKFPPGLQDPTNIVNMYLFKDAGPADSRLSDSPTYPSLTGGTLFLDYTKVTIDTPNVASGVRFTVSGAPDLNATLIQSTWLGGTPTASTAIACWDARYSSMAGVLSSNTIIGYEMSLFSLSPSGGSGGSNIGYGGRIRGPLIQTANGSWTEVAALNLIRAGRSVSNPTVTTGYIAKCEMPNLGTTDQIGIDIQNVTDSFQHTPTNRRGIRVGDLVKGTALRVSYSANGQSTGTPTDVYAMYQETAHVVGTNRYGARFTGATTGTPTLCVGVQADAHAVGTTKWSFVGNDPSNFNGIQMFDPSDFIIGSATGSHIGTTAAQKIGFWGKTPAAQPAAYTPTNVTTDRSYDANSTTVAELADVLGTLITDLQSIGLVA